MMVGDLTPGDRFTEPYRDGEVFVVLNLRRRQGWVRVVELRSGNCEWWNPENVVAPVYAHEIAPSLN
jgi:hypothetical protein